MNEIVVGYDGSEESERALVRAAQVAEALATKLVVASLSAPGGAATVPELAPVVPEPVTVPGSTLPGSIPGFDTPFPQVPGTGRGPEPEVLAERQLEQARATLQGRAVDAEFVVAVGDPAERLLELAELRDAELVVVGSREHGFLERLLGNPLDEQVARHAHRDVLLVH